MDETLRLIAGQLQYGHKDELTGDCLQTNLDIMKGQCVLTYNWGNQMDTLLGAAYDIGVASTPGSRLVLDRSTGRLNNCTNITCPYGIVYDDLGLVNVAPYSAFGGWAAGVSNFIPDDRKVAIANFFSYVSNSNQSLGDVLPNPKSRFAQPYRYPQVMTSNWIKAGFNPVIANDFTSATRQVDSPNAVLELRIPAGSLLRKVLDDEVSKFLFQVPHDGLASDSSDLLITETTAGIEQQIQNVITSEDAKRNTTTVLESYQRSLSVYAQHVSQNYIDSDFRQAGCGLCGLICVVCLLLVTWTIRHRKHRVMRASQSTLLVQSCIGILLIAATAFPLSLDESLTSVDVLNVTCMLAPWNYVTGFTILFSSIYSKIRQSEKVFSNPKVYDMLKVRPMSAMKLCIRFLFVNYIILTIWQTSNPLRWVREDLPEAVPNEFGMVDTYGACRGQGTGWLAFPFILFAVNIGMCIIAIGQTFKCRFMELEYNEMQWMPLALFPFVEVWLVGVPILFIVQDNPTGTFIVLTLMIIVTTVVALLAIFAPKEWYVRKFQIEKKALKPIRRPSYGVIVLKHPDVSSRMF